MAAAKKKAAERLVVARESFSADLEGDGYEVFINVGTILVAGDALVKAYPDLFEPVEPAPTR